ncbi:hypothetical protein BGZ68_001011 [Mortierella alpina]|nr:hypothetical protein BGZ68_001011 [Mortierella alpina]
MVRITLSSLVSFLLVLLVATAAEAAGIFKLVNGNGGWAKNFPPGAGRPPFFTLVDVDNGFASIYERWNIERFEDGYQIRNEGTGFWLTAHGKEVGGSSELDEGQSTWYIQPAGNGKYKILVRNEDLVVTARQTQPGYPVTLILKPSDGSESQLWSFERTGFYSK